MVLLSVYFRGVRIGNWLCFEMVYNSACGLDESEINAIQESELKSSYDSLHKYRDLCTNKEVSLFSLQRIKNQRDEK